MKEPLRKLTQEFYKVYFSDLTSDDARAWNKIREDIIVESLQYHLLPMGARWTREWLKDIEEDWVAGRCAAKLEEVTSEEHIFIRILLKLYVATRHSTLSRETQTERRRSTRPSNFARSR